jgi:elongation factor P
MLDFSEIKTGKIVNFNNAPCVITKCDFLRMQMRKPVKKCSMRNLVTNASIDYSFKSGESVEESDIKRLRATYMYTVGNQMSYMLTDTYETVDIDIEMLEGKTSYLTEGLDVTVISYNENPISIELPIKVVLVVTETNDVVKGSTVSDVSKEAKVETGAILKVPSFIKVGDKIIFNTVEDEYTGRES